MHLSSPYSHLYRHARLLIPLFILVSGFLLHGDAIDGNWRWDDTAVLKHILLNSSILSFVDPQLYAQFSSTNLFPWILISYDFDYRLFGLRPSMFYLHHILSICLAAIALYAVSRQWMRPTFAATSAILFLLGTPIAVISEQLMTRHYIEGLVFSLLSLYLITKYLRDTGDRKVLIISLLFYSVAVSCKEVYVPLFLLFPFLPENGLSSRLKATAPFAVVAIFYALWRVAMLDTFGGGYTGNVDLGQVELVTTTIAAFSSIPALLFPEYSILVLTGLVILCSLYIYLTKSRFVVAVVFLLLCLGPLAPLAVTPGITAPDRYLLVLWVGFSFLLPFLAQEITGKLPNLHLASGGVLAAIIASIMFLSFINSRNHIDRFLVPIAGEYDAHAEFISQNSNTAAYIPGPTVLANYWYINTFEDIVLETEGAEQLPLAIVDDSYLHSGLRTLVSYSGECRCMRDITETIPMRIAAHRASLRPEAALEVTMAYEDRVLSWRFGPYPDGEYHVVSDWLGAFPLPRQGSQRTSFPEPIKFRTRYTSPEGWITYSEELDLTPDGEAVQWSRN